MKQMLIPKNNIYKVEGIVNKHINILESGKVHVESDYVDILHNSIEKLRKIKELINPTLKALKKDNRRTYSKYLSTKKLRNEAYNNKNWDKYNELKVKTEKLLNYYLEMKKLIDKYEEFEKEYEKYNNNK